MAKLKLPSVQHLARHWAPEPEKIMHSLVGLVKSAPPFSYAPMNDAMRDILVLGQSAEEIKRVFRKVIKWDMVLAQYQSILEPLTSYFEQIDADFVHDIEKRHYPVGKELKAPFKPPLLYGLNGELHVPWPIFWRKNYLVNERLSFFLSMVDDILSQDPDLDSAHFDLLDFSELDKDAGVRVLKFIDTSNVRRLGDAERKEYLEVFAQGYKLAAEYLAANPLPPRLPKNKDGDDHQLPLFDK